MKVRDVDFEIGQISLSGDVPKDVRDAYVAGLRRAASFASSSAHSFSDRGVVINPLERLSLQLEQIAMEES